MLRIFAAILFSSFALSFLLIAGRACCSHAFTMSLIPNHFHNGSLLKYIHSLSTWHCACCWSCSRNPPSSWHLKQADNHYSSHSHAWRRWHSMSSSRLSSSRSSHDLSGVLRPSLFMTSASPVTYVDTSYLSVIFFLAIHGIGRIGFVWWYSMQFFGILSFAGWLWICKLTEAISFCGEPHAKQARPISLRP